MKSYDLSLKELIKERPYLFQIPNYQRSYVWGKEQIKEYLKDITYCYESNLRGVEYDHFFGQMIFRKCDVDKSDRELLEIVDGQQRLTTITLTIAALYRLILINCETVDDEVKEILLKIREYIVSTPKYGSTNRRLVLSDKDNEILVKIVIVNEEKIQRGFNYECEYDSQGKILGAYTQVFDYLEQYFKTTDKVMYAKSILEFLDVVLSNISVVVLKPDNIGYSYALYQIVNDRGVLLTPAELLKARTLELLHGNDTMFNECEKIWDDILNDAGSDTTKYLIWHFVSKKYTSVSKNKLHETYEKKLFDCYGKHTISDDEQKKLCDDVKQLYQSVKWCRILEKGILPMEKVHPQIKDMYRALVIGLKNEIAIPIYLNLLRITNEKILINQTSFVTVILSKFFFSARAIVAVHNTSISNAYHYLSEKIGRNTLDTNDIENYFRSIQKNKDVVSSFTAKMSDSIYLKTSVTNSKYLLYILELFAETDDISYKHILKRDKSNIISFEDVSTEHIASRTGADGNKLKEDKRNSLGNLTPLGENKNNELKDKPFEIKKKIYALSPFTLTKKVANYAKWGNNEFKERQKELSEKALKIFLI